MRDYSRSEKEIMKAEKIFVLLAAISMVTLSSSFILAATAVSLKPNPKPDSLLYNFDEYFIYIDPLSDYIGNSYNGPIYPYFGVADPTPWQIYVGYADEDMSSIDQTQYVYPNYGYGPTSPTGVYSPWWWNNKTYTEFVYGICGYEG
jgi:hypothetical protein